MFFPVNLAAGAVLPSIDVLLFLRREFSAVGLAVGRNVAVDVLLAPLGLMLLYRLKRVSS